MKIIINRNSLAKGDAIESMATTQLQTASKNAQTSTEQVNNLQSCAKGHSTDYGNFSDQEAQETKGIGNTIIAIVGLGALGVCAWIYNKLIRA